MANNPVEDPIKIRMRNDATVELRRSGGTYKVYIDDQATDVAIKKKDTLIIEGGGSGTIKIDPKGGFPPRLQIDTEYPVLVEGSFVRAGESTQSALVDLTPVELTSMEGLVERKRKNPVAAAGQPEWVMDHDLEINENAISVGRNRKFPKDAVVLQYEVDGKKYYAATEPTKGNGTGEAVQIVNFADSHNQLMTLNADESTAQIKARYDAASKDALHRVGNALDLRNNWSEGKLSVMRAELGIPEEALRGDVKYKEVDARGAAFAAINIRQQNGQRTSSSRFTLFPETAIATGASAKLMKHVKDHSYWVLDRHKEMLGEGFPIIRRSDKTNPGTDLGNALRKVRDAAELLYHERSGQMRPEQLKNLHEGLKEVDSISDEIIVNHSESGDGRHAPRIVDEVGEIKRHYANIAFQIKDMKELQPEILHSRSTHDKNRDARTIMKNIQRNMDALFDEHEEMYVNGYPITRRGNGSNPTVELGDAMRQISDAASELSAGSSRDRDSQLSALQDGINKANQAADEIISTHRNGGTGRHAPRIVTAIRQVKSAIGNAEDEIYYSSELQSEMQQIQINKGKKESAMLPKKDSMRDKLAALVPEGLPKFAMQDADAADVTTANAAPRALEGKEKNGRDAA